MKKISIGITALAVILLLGVGLVVAGPHSGKSLHKNYDSDYKESYQAMKNAIETEDYDAWKTLMDTKVVEMKSRITQENFDAIVEKQKSNSEFKIALLEAKESGDYTNLEALKENSNFKSHAFGAYGKVHGFRHKKSE